mgnify:FL=1|jgi:hypothetical protein
MYFAKGHDNKNNKNKECRMSKNKKGGRPKKTESEKAKHRVSTYLTDAQLGETYLRMGLFGYHLSRKNVGRFFAEKALTFISREDLINDLRQERLDCIYIELSRIGNNINQLTKAIHSGKESINQEGINLLLELNESILDMRRSVLS